MTGLNLVTDRAQTDIDYLLLLKEKIKNNTASQEEKDEWNSNSLKGSYNYTDFNRCNSAMRYLKELAVEYGLLLDFPYTLRTNWAKGDVPTIQLMMLYLANIQTARDFYNTSSISPSVPQSIKTLGDANDLEMILLATEKTIYNIIECYSYSGDCYCGDLV